jgi:cation:H+ antiporter
MTVWLGFIACTLVIMFAGAKLSKYGGIIADLTGLGRTWIGVVLIASVTSLPELITGVASVALHNLPDIAAGDVLGSCMFNIVIIALLDFLSPAKPVLSAGGKSHILNGAFGIAGLGIINISLLLGPEVPVLGWAGIYSPVLLVGYLFSMRLLFKLEQRSSEKEEPDASGQDISKTRAFTIYGINAALIIAAASFLPRLGQRIAEMTGLEQSFVGTLFIAMSTSLPEFVITYTALRRGARDLALGNLFGSNLFNMAILAVEDLVFTSGPLLSAISRSHAATANSAVLMTAIALVGLAYGGRGKHLGFGWASVALILVFITGTFLSYHLGTTA